MEIKYYGTAAGGGIPEIFCSCRVCEQAREKRGKEIRTRSQAVIDGRLCIDFPVDTLLHTIHGDLDMRSIHHILITHNHHDHYLPADILSRPQGVAEPVRFYCSEDCGKGLKNAVAARDEAYRTGKRVKTCDFDVEVHYLEMFTPVDILDYRVTPLKARHGAPSSMMYAIEGGGKSILWAHDTGVFPEETVAFLKESRMVFDFVSLDCTLKRGNPITKSHMDLNQCLEMIKLLKETGNADEHTRFAISHIGHLLEQTHEELAAEAGEYGIEVAFDGMTVTI